MNTLDLDNLQKITAQAQKLQTIARDLQPFLEMVRDFDGLPTDRLIRAGEVAKILGVNQSTIGALVKAKLLTPYYVTNQKKFWLSQVMKLPRKQPWNLRSD